MCDSITIGGNVSIQISGGGASVQDIQSGLATAAALAALATSVAGREQAISVNAPNHIAVTADMTSATWNAVATPTARVWVSTDAGITAGGGFSLIGLGGMISISREHGADLAWYAIAEAAGGSVQVSEGAYR